MKMLTGSHCHSLTLPYGFAIRHPAQGRGRSELYIYHLYIYIYKSRVRRLQSAFCPAQKKFQRSKVKQGMVSQAPQLELRQVRNKLA